MPAGISVCGPQEKIPETAKWGRSLRYCGHRDAPSDARLAAVHIDATGAAFAVISQDAGGVGA